MAVADHEAHPRAVRRRDDGVAIIERERERLLDEQMLAVPRREHRVDGVELMRGRHVDDVDRRIGAQVLDVRVGLGGKFRRETSARLGARVGRRHQRDPRVGGKGRHHHGKRAPEPGDADAQLALR